MDCNISYLIVEDQDFISKGLIFAFSRFPKLSLVGVATDGAMAVEMAMSLVPDMILMDLGLPKMDGIEATRLISKALPNIKILIHSTREGPRDIFASFAAGASGYCRKDTSAREFYEVMQASMAGQFTIDPKIAGYILAFCCELQWSTTLTGVDDLPFAFTEMELGLVALFGKGLDSAAMAETLGLAPEILNKEKWLLRDRLASLGSRLCA